MLNIAKTYAVARVPTEEDLIARAEGLKSYLREMAPINESRESVHPDVIQTFTEMGFFKMFQPKCWGGYETHPATIFRVQEILAQGCPSSAWLVGVLGVHNWQLAHFSFQAQREVWQDNPNVLMSSSYAPTGKVTYAEGGCYLDGTWHYSSGVDHCDWILAGGNVFVEGSPIPDYRTYLVHRNDFDILDDWKVMGLKGTGSKSVLIKNAFVPHHRQLSAISSQLFNTPGMQDGVATSDLYKVPFPTIFGSCITTPALGAAQAMLDIYVENTKVFCSRYDGSRVATEQTNQIRIAESESDIQAARNQMRHNFNEVMEALSSGRDLSLEERARYRFDACYLVQRAHTAADRLFVASGARSLAVTQPLQRFYCDIQAARVHAINNITKWGSAYGRFRLDDAPDDMLSLFI